MVVVEWHYQLYGPFSTYAEATSWAANNAVSGYVVRTLITPEVSDEPE